MKKIKILFLTIGIFLLPYLTKAAVVTVVNNTACNSSVWFDNVYSGYFVYPNSAANFNVYSGTVVCVVNACTGATNCNTFIYNGSIFSY